MHEGCAACMQLWHSAVTSCCRDQQAQPSHPSVSHGNKSSESCTQCSQLEAKLARQQLQMLTSTSSVALRPWLPESHAHLTCLA